jgi:hypothetical protein
MRQMTLRFILFLVLLALVASCTSTTQGLLVSGESLKAVGTQFVAAGPAFVTGCQAGTIKPVDCQTFKAFGEKFKQEYPLAISLWQAAVNANDAAAAKNAAAVIMSLATDLSAIALQAGVQVLGR